MGSAERCRSGYLGFIFAEGDSYDEVEKSLGTAGDQLRILIE